MPESTHAFFDPPTVTMQREVLEDAWSRLAAGQRIVSRSLLAERILKAAKAASVILPSCEHTRSLAASRPG